MQIVPLTTDDLDAVNELQPAEWPDIVPHHEYYLEHAYCKPFKAVDDNQVAGIGTVIYHGDTAWLAHIIVHPDFRNKGIGTQITAHLIKSVDKTIYQTIYLIATELGEPVYRKLGFETEAEFIFFKGDKIHESFKYNEQIIPFDEKFRSQLYELDNIVSGENRQARLDEHLEEAILHCSDDELNGFFLPNLGEGLIIAKNKTTGLELMEFRLHTKEIAAVPVVNTTAIKYLQSVHFLQFRTAKRMFLGKKRSWQPEKIYNRISGQIG